MLNHGFLFKPSSHHKLKLALHSLCILAWDIQDVLDPTFLSLGLQHVPGYPASNILFHGERVSYFKIYLFSVLGHSATAYFWTHVEKSVLSFTMWVQG